MVVHMSSGRLRKGRWIDVAIIKLEPVLIIILCNLPHIRHPPIQRLLTHPSRSQLNILHMRLREPRQQYRHSKPRMWPSLLISNYRHESRVYRRQSSPMYMVHPICDVQLSRRICLGCAAGKDECLFYGVVEAYSGDVDEDFEV